MPRGFGPRCFREIGASPLVGGWLSSWWCLRRREMTSNAVDPLLDAEQDGKDLGLALDQTGERVLGGRARRGGGSRRGLTEQD